MELFNEHKALFQLILLLIYFCPYTIGEYKNTQRKNVSDGRTDGHLYY